MPVYMKFKLNARVLKLCQFRNIILLSVLVFLQLFASCTDNNLLLPRLKVSENKRFLVTENGDPFFWLGDTGWMLFTKLTREEAETYLENRKQQGFNVIQVMILHDLRNEVNAYGDTALTGNRIDQPKVTPGSSFADAKQYDFWDHVDYLVDLAAKKGLYMAMVPVWGSNVRSGLITREQAEKYALWIAERFRNRHNVIWINGGDVRGDDSTAIWNIIGSTIRKTSKNQLITYHPFGRTQSSTWFHNEQWIDLNMFQSGHRRYDQDTTGLAYGEDNWKYASDDYLKKPVRPTIDGEPSYEGIPQGLHDTTQPYWTDSDVRRYAYWSVFAGCCGFTYGNNSIMQFYKPSDMNPAYGAKEYWNVALNAPGASHMKYLKQLILSKPYFERVPAGELLAGKQGTKYDYIAITRGKDYVFAYTYNGSDISLDMKMLSWPEYKISWFDPRNGKVTYYSKSKNSGITAFDPPGEKTNGNDWVLILEKN
jgi:hypothetical protein